MANSETAHKVDIPVQVYSYNTTINHNQSRVPPIVQHMLRIKSETAHMVNTPVQHVIKATNDYQSRVLS